MRKILFAFSLFIFSISEAKISYSLNFTTAHTNYLMVSMRIDNIKGSYADLKMPAWAPGSYLLREFSKDVIAITADGGEKIEKLDKGTWRVYKKSGNSVRVNYVIYAFELSVRNSYVDRDHAYLNGSSVFLYVDGRKHEEHEVLVEKRQGWNTLSVALPKRPSSEGFILRAFNYDELVDAPMEYGSHTEWTFTAEGVSHTLAIFGKGGHESKKDSLIKDLSAIIKEATAVFGSHPCSSYVFIIHNLDQGGGGLEHKNSTTCQVYRWNWNTESGYQGILSLLAHEYFHLWNVKRLRPVELGPFNYAAENYTKSLWVAEGFTAYYDELLLRRAGVFSVDKYLKTVTGNMNAVLNTPGNKRQSLAEASFDAWIKFYRPNENSRNVSVSYYGKGAMVANLLDLIIMRNSKGTRCLDHALKLMYEEFYLKKERGYTETELKQSIEKVAGEDLGWFFDRLVYGTEELSYDEIFKYAGLNLTDQNAKIKSPWPGFTTNVNNGKTMVNYVEINGPAFGIIQVNDEILAVNGYRMNNDVQAHADRANVGDKMEILLARGGTIRPAELTLKQKTEKNFALSMDAIASDTALAVRKKWLRL